MSGQDATPGRHRGDPTGASAAAPFSFSVNRRTVLVGAGSAALVAYAASDQAGALDGALSDFFVNDPNASLQFYVNRAEDSMVLRFRLYNMKLVTAVPSGSEPYLTQTDPARVGLLLVDFTPQSVGEESSKLAEGPDVATTQPAANSGTAGFRARSVITPIATRLAFAIPTSIPVVRPSLEAANGIPGLLSWESFIPQLTTGINHDNRNTYGGPGPFETIIGAPYGLGLSPEPNGWWVHSQKPVTHPGPAAVAAAATKSFTEVWQTRLGSTIYVGIDEVAAPAEFPVVTPQGRAVFSAYFKRTATDAELNAVQDMGHIALSPMTATDRQSLVRLTSDYTNDRPDVPLNYRYVPKPFDARRLMIGSAGASLDIKGNWAPPSSVPPVAIDDCQTAIDLSSWSHRSTQGRDHHVVLTYLGYLLPFGHPAVLVKETERRFETTSKTNRPMANLRTKMYVVVRRHEMTFGADSDLIYNFNENRDLPFTKVRINTRSTPSIGFQKINDDGGQPVSGVRFLMVNGEPFPFSVTAWDHQGRKVNFTMPMAFVTKKAAVIGTWQGDPKDDPSAIFAPDLLFGEEPGTMHAIDNAYDNIEILDPSDPNYGFSTAQLHGQPVAVAPPKVPGDTTLRFDSLTFSREVGDPAGYDTSHDVEFSIHDQMRDLPRISKGQARIPAVQNVSPGATSEVRYDTDYVDHAFGDGSDQQSIYMKVITGQPLDYTAHPSTGGASPGVVTPNVNVGALSINRGLIGGDANAPGGGVAQFKNGTFAPKDFLSDAKLLGGLELAAIIVEQTFGAGDANIPVLTTTEIVPDGPGGIPDYTKLVLRTALDWSPDVQSGPPGFTIFEARDDGTTRFHLHAQIDRPVGGGPATSEVTGSLKNFKLNLFGGEPFLVLTFNEFSFHSRNGAKPTVVPDIAKVEFKGALSFVEQLASLLSSGDGNGITVTPTQVTAQYSIAVPSIGVGVFALTNLALSIGIDIPFIDKPARVRVGISTRESPFHLSVMIFTGGGFVGLALGADGMELLEIALEFGASVGIDVGVASGSLEIMAGIYFAVGKATDGPGERTELTGYVKAHGALDFGPVGISLTFNLSLTYLKDGQVSSAYGQVQVHVEVHVLVFSGSVDFTARKQFAGGNDPGFADTLSFDDFQKYAAAFG